MILRMKKLFEYLMKKIAKEAFLQKNIYNRQKFCLFKNQIIEIYNK